MALMAGAAVEYLNLQLFKSPRYAYACLCLLGAVQSIYALTLVPETLEVAKRRPLDIGAGLNVFGFVNLFRKGSSGLKKMVISSAGLNDTLAGVSSACAHL